MNIFVSNINYRTQNESLLNLFASYGEVTSARIITDRETGRSRGFGFVDMPRFLVWRIEIVGCGSAQGECRICRYLLLLVGILWHHHL